MADSRCAIVLAAGQGTRMKSALGKVLHTVAGRPMVRRVVDAAVWAGCDPVVVVVGHQQERVQTALEPVPRARFAVQEQQLGTGHAVRCAASALELFEGTALILPSDVPLMRSETLADLAQRHETDGNAVTVLSMELADPAWYGRVIRDAGGRVLQIVEARDCDAEQLAVREINTGIYAVDVQQLFGADGNPGLLDELGTDNDQGEFYLTDIVSGAGGRGLRVDAFVHERPLEVQGVNDREELARVENLLYRQVARRWMKAGVTFQDPDGIRVDPEVTLAADVVLESRAQLRGGVSVAAGAVIGSGAILTDCTVGAGAVIGAGCVLQAADIKAGAQVRPYSIMTGINEKKPAESTDDDRVVVGEECRVGPFSHLRMRSALARDVHVGNFVETKNTRLHAGAKANHLAYLGDGRIGRRSNVGAGVIFCNYDGLNKHVTEIGEDAFVGSDSQLVAPVTVGDRAYVGSGTTVTKDVPAGSLMVTRARPQLIQGAGDRKHERVQRAKRAKRAAAKDTGEPGGGDNA